MPIRPYKLNGTLRDKIYQLRISEKEYEALQGLANDLGINVAILIRRSLKAYANSLKGEKKIQRIPFPDTF
jgi:hypothetical protein